MRPAAALLLCAALSAPAAASPSETQDFYSADRAVRVTVEYYGSNGSGEASVSVRGASGGKLSSFRTDLPPFSVTVSGDGSRLFFFCGSWGQSVSIYLMEVYSSGGRKLASHKLRMSGPSGEGFSADGRLYAVGASDSGRDTVLVVNVDTGKAVWRKSFKERLSGLRLADSGGSLLAVFEPAAGGRRAALFGPSGEEVWSETLKTGRDLLPKVLNKKHFELWEEGAVYDKNDGYWHARLLRKRLYRITGKGVVPEGVLEVNKNLP